jgi:ABC transport system ATP-binding/permease protein
VVLQAIKQAQPVLNVYSITNAKPCLMITSRENSPQSDGSPYIELHHHSKSYRFSLGQSVHRLGRDSTWADLVVSGSGWEVLSGRHALFLKEGNLYRIYDGDGEAKPSTNGLFINHRRITHQTGLLLDENMQLQIGQDPANLVILTYVMDQVALGAAQLNKYCLDLDKLQDWPVHLGRDVAQRYAAIELDAPTVSRCHATLDRKGEQYILHDQSVNGTFVNKKYINSATVLQSGDLIQIGPFTLLFRDHVLELQDRGDQIRLDAYQLFRKVKQRRGEKIILNHVSFSIEPGHLVAIVGGSGAGKSTLMKTLLGIEPTTSGAVLLNGENLRQNFDRYRSEIGYVPQDDIVHENLTVEEVLSFACQLRLPPDTDLEQAISYTLDQVKLSQVRSSRIKVLSGGQRKRVSIAVELLANPKLFFLDEPTSGLDPGLDKKMMYLLRELANQDRTIILVTHATSNLEMCDRIAFMGAGGQLCYYGPPQEAMSFFKMPASDFKYFADIYIELEKAETAALQQQIVEEWAEQFRQSHMFQLYVAAAMNLSQSKVGKGLQMEFSRGRASPFRQWWILSRRYLKLVWRDRLSFGLMLLTAPVGISLITLTLQDKNPLGKLKVADVTQAPLALQVLFVFTCATLWVGLTSTCQSIIREASIYARERLVNLGLLPYLGSKLFVHASLALIQALVITAVILISFRSPELDLLSWPIGCSITSYLTLISSVCMGLMISALVKNTNQANNVLPLIFLPQIVFSGILFKLKGLSNILSWFMLSRWSVGAYGILANVNGMVPEQPKILGVAPTPLPFEPTPMYDVTWENLGLNWGMLCLHSFVYTGIAIWQQKRKDIT